jgi:hypothetical protein
MWLLFARAPSPAAPYWPGRRLLAASDALAWTAVWIAVAAQLPQATGVVGPMVMAIATLSALGRVHRAVMVNHRYQFTTWRWGRLALILLLGGLILKVAVPA